MTRRILPLLLIAICFIGNADARRHKPKTSNANQPGKFDYYVLSLSWSPEHCATTHDTSTQCAGTRQFGFVVHGLWPQFEHGYPHDCRGAALNTSQIPNDLLDIMPSTQLVGHEWPKHGTCSGLSQADYFQKIEDAFVLVKIPPEYKAPLQNVEVAPSEIKSKFVSNNPSLGAGDFAVVCSGRFLQEVRVCMTKDLKGRACAADVHDTCSDSKIILRPVR